MNQRHLQTIYENEEDRQLARILSTLVWVTWVAYLFAFFTAIYNNDWKLIVATLTGSVFLIASLVLLGRGHLHASNLIVVLSTLGTVTIIATVGQGIRDLAIVAFPIIFIFAGLTLNRALFRLCVGLALAAVCWLVFGEIYGWFVTRPFEGEMANWLYLIGTVIILLLAALAVDLLTTNMRKSLERAWQEIAQRKQAEEEVKSSARRFQALIEHGRDNISLLAADGTLLWENPSPNHILGYAPDQFRGHNIFELMHPDDQAWTRTMYAQVVQSPGNIQEGEFRLLHADSTWRWIECSATNLLTEPSVQAIVLNYRDITERRRAEDALREKEVQYHNLADSDTALIWRSGTDKLCNYFNLPWLKFTGRTLEQEMGNGWTEGVHPDDFDRCLEIYTTAFDKREAFGMDYRLRHVSGEYRWIQDLGTPNYNSSGKFVGYIGHCFDITERKRAENELFQQKNMLDTIIESTSASIFVKDTDGKYIVMNEAGARTLGYSVTDVIGHTDLELLPIETASEIRKMDEDAMASGQTCEQEEIININGKRKVFLAHKTPWRDSSGKIIGIIGVSNDITERKQAEDQLLYKGTHDALTGIYNRAFFEVELARFEHSREYPTSMIIADVDNLKVANDTLGHAVGDELLRSATNILRTVFRESDVLARIGGDEFAVLLPSTDSASAEQMLTRVQERLAKHNAEHADLPPVQLSLGMATAEKNNLTEVFTLADQRMYANKAARKANANHSSAS